MQVTYGPYGPYVRQGRTYAPLRDVDPAEVGLERAIQMIRDKEAAPKAKGPFGRGRRGASASKAGAQAAAAQGSAEGSAETGPAAGGTEAAGAEKSRAFSRPRQSKAAKASKAAGKAGKGKGKKASSKQPAASARAGSKSAWSQFLGSQWPGLKEQQPDISFGDVRPHFVPSQSTASCNQRCCYLVLAWSDFRQSTDVACHTAWQGNTCVLLVCVMVS